MGFWRDIAFSVGLCDEFSKDERDKARKTRAARLSRHPYGCNCCWCQCASDDPRKVYED